MNVDCEVIRAAILAGEFEAGPEVQRHIDECDACRELVAGGPLVDLLQETAPRLELPPAGGPLDRLRSLSTRMRILLLVLAVLFVTAFNTFFALRTDAVVFPFARMLLTLAALAIPAVLAGMLVLRPLFLPRPGRLILPTLVSLGVFIPVVLAFLPAAHDFAHAHPESYEGAGADFWPRAIGCLIYGSVMGAPILLALYLLARGGNGPLVTVLGGLTAAALAGNVALQLHCPILSHAHLFVGHAGVPILAILIGFPLALRRRRRISSSM
ncbi:MAG: hypothetical protein ACYS0E_18490 [Planctomycetota bacterium]|jgi:hypothetical protein